MEIRRSDGRQNNDNMHRLALNVVSWHPGWGEVERDSGEEIEGKTSPIRAKDGVFRLDKVKN